ncbi:MAG: hypothetical protein AAGE03_09685 [Pseudomonadota bacterium]
MTDHIMTEGTASFDGAQPQPDLPDRAVDPLVEAEIERVLGGIPQTPAQDEDGDARSNQVILADVFRPRLAIGGNVVFGSIGQHGGAGINGIGTRLFNAVSAAARHPDLVSCGVTSAPAGAAPLCASAG